MPAPYNGIVWPEKIDGIWEFYMPQVYSPGFDGMTTAMDYNFWFKFNGGQDEPETAPELRGHRQGAPTTTCTTRPTTATGRRC